MFQYNDNWTEDESGVGPHRTIFKELVALPNER
jgi:hypothetical protein